MHNAFLGVDVNPCDQQFTSTAKVSPLAIANDWVDLDLTPATHSVHSYLIVIVFA